MARKPELTDIEGEVQRETEKAYLFFDGSRSVWLPKSCCQWDQNSKTMTMEMWLATEKDLI